MELLGSIGKLLPTIAKVAQPALGALGLFRNIRGGAQQDAVTQAAIKNQQDLQAMAKNPALLMARARALQQPLSTGLVEGVGNDVQAQLSERGLSTSPNIATSIMSQSLAPYEQHNQDEAMRSVLQLLGLPTSALGAIPEFKPTDTSSFWEKLLALTGNGGGSNSNIRLPGSITGDVTPPFLPGGGDNGAGSIDPFGGAGAPTPPIFGGDTGGGGDTGFNF